MREPLEATRTHRLPCVYVALALAAMKLLANVAMLSSARIGTLVAAVMLNVLTARALGPAGRGAYSLPGIDASLASTFLLGLQTATSFALLNVGARRSVLRPAVATALLFVAFGSLVATAVAGLNHHVWAAFPAMLYLPASAASSLASGYWIGRDRMKAVGMLGLASTFVTLVCVAVGLRFFGHTSQVAIGGWLAGQTLVAACALAAVLRDDRDHGSPLSFARYVRYAGRAGALNIVTLLSYRVDVLLVAALTPIEVLGLYTVAVAGAESVLALTYAVNAVAAPRLGSSDRREAAAFAARCTRNTLAFATILAVVIALVGPLAVRILFGSRFVALVPALRILLVGVVALSTGGVIANYFMLNRNIARVPLLTGGTSAAISAILGVALIPRFGMIGAAVSVSAGYLVGQTFAIWAFCRDSEIAPIRLLLIDRTDLRVYAGLVSRAWRRFRPASA